jgi:transaldolase
VYVERLVAPEVINTMPEQTLRAFAQHGTIGPVLEADPAAAEQTLAAAAAVGVDLPAITAELEREGVQSSADSYAELVRCIEYKRAQITASGPG